jgi:hypothetical protein
MECPFCAESVKEEAVACKHCSRDLRIARPVMLEVRAIVSELDLLQRQLDRLKVRLARARSPARYAINAIAVYVIVPVVLLVAAHIIVTIVLDATPLYLRLASVVIPLPFGLALYQVHKIGFRGALLAGFGIAAIAVGCMLTVTGINDNVPIIPASWVEWREVIEYVASIALAFATGNILGFLLFDVLPQTVSRDGKPNAIAFTVAGAFGKHIGDDQLRRRARGIQDLLTTAGPLVGIAVTAGGSVYAGLKGIFGW